MKGQTIPVRTIISSLYRDIEIDGISESDVLEWCLDALEHIGVRESFAVNTCFLQVDDHQCEIPHGCHEILGIAKHREMDKRPAQPREMMVFYDDPEETVQDENCPCRETPVQRVKICKSFYENWNWYFPFRTYTNPSGKRISDWLPVNVSRNSFFSPDTRTSTPLDEYAVKDGKIVFSFRKGFIVMSYLGVMKDEEGFPMIPDDVSAREAITKYVIMKYMARKWYEGREGYQDKMAKAEHDWHWYCKQYKKKVKMPSEDEYRSFVKRELDMFPRFSKDFLGYVHVCSDIRYGCDINNIDRCTCSDTDLGIIVTDDSTDPLDRTDVVTDSSTENNITNMTTE